LKSGAVADCDERNSLLESIQNSTVLFHTHKKLDRTRNAKTFKETAYFYLASNRSITVRVIYT